MTEEINQNKNQPITRNSNLWGSQKDLPVEQYFKVVWRPVILALLGELLWFFGSKYLGLTFLELWPIGRLCFIWSLKLLAAIWLGYLIVKVVNNRLYLTGPALATGALAGFLVGLVVAVLKIVWYHQFWTIFNLISEPLLTALSGAVLVGLFSWLFNKIRFRSLNSPRNLNQ